MADLAKILGLVAEGKLSAADADEILAALNDRAAEAAETIADRANAAADEMKKSTHLRVEITDDGRHLVNLRVPINIYGWASNFLPGLSEQDSDRIRGAVASGTRGTILDIKDGNGKSRVLITSD